MCVFVPVLAGIKGGVCGIFFMSLVAGLLPEFNETFSFSRTICFSGYFLLGYYSDRKTLDKIRRNKNIIIISGIIVTGIICAYCAYGGIEKTVLADALHRHESYGNIGLNITNGIVTRAASIPIAIILGMLVMAVVPARSNIFTKLGRNSIIILIFHEYFVLVFWKTAQVLNIKTDNVMWIIILVIFSAAITMFLSTGTFKKLYIKIMKTIETIVLKNN
jgi:fucose 4-O-acetylase-like acetyltransferase